jgi:hypothetical protein
LRRMDMEKFPQMNILEKKNYYYPLRHFNKHKVGEMISVHAIVGVEWLWLVLS